MNFDVTIIGGGIVGLATAYQLQQQRPSLKIAVLEKEKEVAHHQTGRNSGVIHSGIYYRPGSLKARNCQEGYVALLDFCDHYGIAHDICGKIIVATDEWELPMLERIWQTGNTNGLSGLKRLNSEQIKEYEPFAKGIAAIFVPQTGIIDFQSVAQTYACIFQENGGTLQLGEKVQTIRQNERTIEVVTNGGTLQTKYLINCAGLYADKIAQLTDNQLFRYKVLPFKGEYYELRPEKRYLVKNLIYPVPNPNFPFLGVHFTRMIRGGIEAGPNAVLALGRESYEKTDIHVPELLETLTFKGFQRVAKTYWREGLEEFRRSWSKRRFVRTLQRLIPSLEIDDVTAAAAGVRAQVCDADGKLIDDFLILEHRRVINVLNAPSPAATASLAVGKAVAQRVGLTT